MERQNNKLLELVETCINNKTFYLYNKKAFEEQNWNNPIYLKNPDKIHEGKERIEVIFNCLEKKSMRLIERECKADNNSESHWYYDRDVFLEKLRSIGMFCQNHIDKDEKFYEGMNIIFAEYPQINIKLRFKKNELKKVSDFFIDEIKPEYKRKTNWKFWQNKENVKTPTGRKIKYNINEISYSYNYSIECGSIEENISIEQYNKLFEKYKLNLEKFTKEIDEERIQQRLDKYKI